MTAMELVCQQIHLCDKMKTPSTDEDCVIFEIWKQACVWTLSLNYSVTISKVKN